MGRNQSRKNRSDLMIPYGRQDVTEEDIQAVVDVLRSDFLTQGPVVPRFEESVARYCGATHAVAANSATSALHMACLALGLEAGDTLWTTPITFVASANCAIYCGARVDFVDIDPITGNLSPERLEEKLIRAEHLGCLPKILVAVHLSGQPCDMIAIHRLAQRYSFHIIEDASHAIGASYMDEPIGNCRYSDITVFSFHPVKVITTGEGGMAVTNSYELATRMGLLRSHGITRDPTLMVGEPEGPWYYQQIVLGFNYRMTDIQAALGVSQMQRLADFVARREELAGQYDAALKDLPIVRPWQNPVGRSAWHLYTVRLPDGKTQHSRRWVFDAFRTAGIGVNVHYIPVHLQPYYKSIGFREGMFPEAERYYSEAISLPIFPRLSNEQQARVIEELKKVLSK